MKGPLRYLADSAGYDYDLPPNAIAGTIDDTVEI